MELGSIMRIIGLDEWNSMEHVPCRQQLILKLTRGIVCSLLSSLMRPPNFESSYSKWLANGCRQWWKLKTRAAKDDIHAHLLCELFLRLKSVGLTHGDAYEMPNTQAELAARPSPGKGRCNCHGKVPKFEVEFNCLDHEDIAQRFKFDSRLRIGPRAPKALLRLFKPIVWSRSIWPVYHELMPEALPVP